MDQNGAVSFRHRQSPSSDRFLGVFSPPQSDSAIGGVDVTAAGDELNEDDVFWTGDFNEPPQRRPASPSQNSRRQGFRQPEKFGILAALPEDRHRQLDSPVLYRKPSLTSSPSGKAMLLSSPPISTSPSSAIAFSRAIPKPPLNREHSFNRNVSQSMPVRKFQHSAPMNVPMMPRKPPRNGELAEIEIDDDDEMLPPHEIVARGGSSRSPTTTFSVLEGVGRTLKGRDLRQVRNAVWRQTGFQD